MTRAGRVTDPRTRRTVALLREALGELLHTQNLSQITVSELCRTAGVHRTTFYKHYESVSDFARSAFAAVIDEALTERPLQDGVDVVDAYREAMVRLLEHVAAHRARFRRLLGPDGDLAFQRAIGDHLADRAQAASPLPGGSGADGRGAATLLGFAAFGLVESWAMSDDEDARGAADRYFAIVAPWQGPA